MTSNRYKVAATLLGGKYRMGVVGRSRPRVEGRIGHVRYTLTSTWERESRTEYYGMFGRKERKRYETNRGHVFHLQSEWLSQPCTLESSGGKIVAVSAVPGDPISLTEEQQELLEAAFSRWQGVEITNHGIEWVEDEQGQTAQHLVLTVEGLAGVLELLPTDRDSVVTRIAAKNPLPSASEFAAMLRKPFGQGSEVETEESESEGPQPKLPEADHGEPAT